MTLLKKLSTARVAPQPGAAGKKPAAPAPDLKAFAGVQVSDKILLKYGAQLQPAVADLRVIGQTALALRPHKATQFGNCLDRYYDSLGKFLEQVPDGERAAVARSAAGALRQVVERLGAGDRLVGGIEALSSLLFHQAKAAGFEARVQAAGPVIDRLLDLVEGRIGAGGLLFVYRNLIESAASKVPPASLEDRAEIWASALSFLAAATPSRGVSQAELGTLFGHFMEASKDAANAPAAFRKATEQALLPWAAPRAALQAQLAQRPPLAEGSPGLQAVEAINAALIELLDRHQAGPNELFVLIEQLAGTLRHYAVNISVNALPAYQIMAGLLRTVAGQSSTESVLRYLGQALTKLADRPGAAQALGKIQRAEDVPSALLRAELVRNGRAEDDALKAALLSLDRLPAAVGAAATIVALPRILQNTVPADVLSAAVAQFARSAETVEALEQLILGLSIAYPTMVAQLGVEHAAPMAMALALDREGQVDAAQAQQAAQAGAQLLALVPELPLARLAAPERGGEASLLALLAPNPQGRKPLAYVARLVQTLAQAPGLPLDAKIALVRRAIRVGVELSRLDRDPETILPQILADWTAALGDPNALHFAPRAGKGAGGQARGAATALGFFEAHPELPSELALTAGLHLNAEQLGWLIDTMQAERSHGKVRRLRDLVFAGAQLGRMDLIEGYRTSKTEPKAKDAALTHLVQNYRVGALTPALLEPVLAGLVAGEDPLVPIRAAQNQAALAAIFPDGALDGPPDPAGMAALERNKATVQAMLAWPANAAHKQHLVRIFQGYATGNIVAAKYESEASAKFLAGLTPAQRAVWIEEGVTAKDAPVIEGPDLQEALPLLKGLPALLDQIKLELPKLGAVAYDQASRQKLAEARDAQIEELRQAPKGSKAHRGLGASLSPINHRLALIDFRLALDAALADPQATAGKILFAIRATLPAAARALRQSGASAGAELLGELEAQSRNLKREPRQGVYATDEHNLDAYFTPFTQGSCINPASGHNRHFLVEKMASGAYKMIRGMNGAVAQSRGFFRLLQVEIGNYRGYAIWADAVQATPTGAASAEIGQVVARHALEKALAMGIPLLTSGSPYDQAAAQARGIALAAHPAKVTIDFGQTGQHHTELLFGAGYSHAIAAGGNYSYNGNFSIAFPPGIAP